MLVVALALLASLAHAQFNFSNVHGDHMVRFVGTLVLRFDSNRRCFSRDPTCRLCGALALLVCYLVLVVEYL
jgi:hypothetical protein